MHYHKNHQIAEQDYIISVPRTGTHMRQAMPGTLVHQYVTELAVRDSVYICTVDFYALCYRPSSQWYIHPLSAKVWQTLT